MALSAWEQFDRANRLDRRVDDLQAEVERLRDAYEQQGLEICKLRGLLAQCRPYVEGLSGVVDETAELLAAIDASQRKEK